MVSNNYEKNGAPAADHWIQGAIKHPGALHKKLGVPMGKKIPSKKLAAAANSSDPTTRKQVNLVKTLKGFNHG